MHSKSHHYVSFKPTPRFVRVGRGVPYFEPFFGPFDGCLYHLTIDWFSTTSRFVGLVEPSFSMSHRTATSSSVNSGVEAREQVACVRLAHPPGVALSEGRPGRSRSALFAEPAVE
jgi:hypothetical protein